MYTAIGAAMGMLVGMTVGGSTVGFVRRGTLHEHEVSERILAAIFSAVALAVVGALFGAIAGDRWEIVTTRETRIFLYVCLLACSAFATSWAICVDKWIIYIDKLNYLFRPCWSHGEQHANWLLCKSFQSISAAMHTGAVCVVLLLSSSGIQRACTPHLFEFLESPGHLRVILQVALTGMIGCVTYVCSCKLYNLVAFRAPPWGDDRGAFEFSAVLIWVYLVLFWFGVFDLTIV